MPSKLPRNWVPNSRFTSSQSGRRAAGDGDWGRGVASQYVAMDSDSEDFIVVGTPLEQEEEAEERPAEDALTEDAPAEDAPAEDAPAGDAPAKYDDFYTSLRNMASACNMATWPALCDVGGFA